MTDHNWALEHLPALGSGELSADEADRLDRHLAICADCRQTVAQQRSLDATLEKLFAPVRPQPGMEDRMIHNLRTAKRRSPLWPWLGSAAAILLMGAMGAGLHAMVSEGELWFPGMELAWAGRSLEGLGGGKKNDPFLTADIDPAANEADQMATYSDVSVLEYPPALGVLPLVKRDSHTSITGGIIGGKKSRVDVQELEKGIPKQRAYPVGDLVLPKNSKESESLSEDAFKRYKSFMVQARVESKDSAPKKPADGLEAASYHPGFGANVRIIEQGEKKNVYGYFGRAGGAKQEDALSLGDKKDSKQPEPKKEEFKNSAGFSPAPRKPAIESGLAALGIQPKEDPPAGEGRKIIRTGEVEFEIDSFDKAHAEISRLVTAIKGAYLVTTSSDKLPNGKVKGSVVVRTSPDQLDRLLTDLRTNLGKMGDLKSQRIGSQDVSKQYTDIQSRLRAARTMEERLLNIIKTGKGEIKDLVAAERELGVWRTKIEEMEGETRYFDNQVSLSTLTVNLTEKEISAPAAVKITERIRMGIEVDDVDKAQKAVLADVAELKGRVTKSDLKQHAAGQLEAIVHLEVAPEQASDMRQRLAQLGNVTTQDAERLQQAEGGTGRPQILKPHISDVRFELTLYNIANIQPRETTSLKLASTDVPTAYRKLQDAVAQAKGQVRAGQLKEEDKLNIFAQFDFDVPTGQKETIDKALTEVGDVISRSTHQVPPAETATTRKVGYRLELHSVASIPPREKITLDVEVKNVDEAFAALVDLARTSKGTIAAAQVTKEKNGQISGLLRFDVPLATKDELIARIKDKGTVRRHQSVTNAQVPESTLATAQFQVTLATSGPIVPTDENLWQQIRTSLFYAFKLLSWSLMFIILGVAFVVPWALLIFVVVKLIRRLRRAPA